jgi:1,4-alpha-glucan branching enzyme
MIVKEPGLNGKTKRVTFQFPASIWCEKVCLVGDFNAWDRYSHPMQRSLHNPDWQITIELEQGRRYQFRYLVNDASWCNDYHADSYVPDPYGGTNSVVEV